MVARMIPSIPHDGLPAGSRIWAVLTTMIGVGILGVLSNGLNIMGVSTYVQPFLTGLIICAPLAITVWLTFGFIRWADSWVKPYIPTR